MHEPDDGMILPEDECGPPTSAGGLLADLGVFGKPREVQRVAVAEWLRENPMPSDFVRWGLERKGLLAARDRAA